MKLTRFAVIALSRPAPARLGRWTYTASNRVSVVTGALHGTEDITGAAPVECGLGPTVAWSYDTDVARLLVSATVDAGAPSTDADGWVAVPDGPRRAAEAAIVEYADTLAISYGCRRRVTSPKPCVAVIGDTDEERAELASSMGLAGGWSRPGFPRYLPDLSDGSPIGTAVVDRLDGVGFLADSLSEDSAAGRIRELFRLFERAFATGPYRCAPLLASFLEHDFPELEFSRDEMNLWFGDLRPTVTHADRREVAARSPEVAPHLYRMEYAAYDVLLNKLIWKSSSSERRKTLPLPAGVGRDGTIVIRASATQVNLTWTDPFASFPIDFSMSMTVQPDWTWKMHGYTHEETKEYSTSIRVSDLTGVDPPVYHLMVNVRMGGKPPTT